MVDKAPKAAEHHRWVPKALVRQVRRYIQDYPEVNELVEHQETTDEQLARWIVDIVDDFNYSPPLMRTFAPTPTMLWQDPELGGVRKWVVDMAAARAMKSIVNKLARNDMPYTAGNTTIQPHAVWRNLQPIVQDLEIQYKEFRNIYKTQKNLEQVWGAVHTDFYLGFYEDAESFIIVDI